MNTFWLKLAGFAILVVGAIFLISMLTSGTGSKPQEPQRTIYDQWDEDDEKLRAEPQIKEPPETTVSTQPGDQTLQQTEPVKQPEPEFKQLSETDEIQAQRLFNMAVQERKMGRLPGINLGYKKMVEHCREIIQKWPESEYAFKAKRMLADIPERYHKMYNITKDEIDLGNLK